MIEKKKLRDRFNPGDIVLVSEYSTDNVDIKNVIARIVFMYENSCIVECEDIPKALNNKIVISYKTIVKTIKAIEKENPNILKNEQKLYWGADPEMPKSISQREDFKVKMKKPIRTMMTKTGF